MTVGLMIFAFLLLAMPATSFAGGKDPCRKSVTKGLAWKTRSGCLAVPLDHSDPAGEQLNVFYEVSEPSAPAVGTIIVFHGGPAYPREHLQEGGYLWRSLRMYFRILYFHQRGSGHSGLVTDPARLAGREHLYTLEAMVEDAGLLHRRILGGGKVIVMGKSAGGFLAMLFALRFPDSVSSMILAATTAHHGYVAERDRVRQAYFRALEERHAGFAEAHQRAQEILSPAILSEMPQLKELFAREGLLDAVFFDLSYTLAGQFETVAMARDLAERRFGLLVKRLSAGRSTLRTTGLESALILNNISCREFLFGRSSPESCPDKEVGDLYDVRDRLPGLTVPVLLLSGRHDSILPPDFQEEIAALLGGEVEWHVLELSSHMLFEEQPRACASYILAFLGIRHQQPAQTPGL
jgi:proline iminopeptidase